MQNRSHKGAAREVWIVYLILLWSNTTKLILAWFTSSSDCIIIYKQTRQIYNITDLQKIQIQIHSRNSQHGPFLKLWNDCETNKGIIRSQSILKNHHIKTYFDWGNALFNIKVVQLISNHALILNISQFFLHDMLWIFNDNLALIFDLTYFAFFFVFLYVFLFIQFLRLFLSLSFCFRFLCLLFQFEVLFTETNFLFLSPINSSNIYSLP